jgi:hypothetical protein
MNNRNLRSQLFIHFIFMIRTKVSSYKKIFIKIALTKSFTLHDFDIFFIIHFRNYSTKNHNFYSSEVFQANTLKALLQFMEAKHSNFHHFETNYSPKE